MGKNHEIKVRYIKEEVEKVRKKAKELGIKPSQYVRMVSLNAKTEIKTING